MANEIKYMHDDAAETIYAVIRSMTGTIWNTDTSTWDTFNPPDWANYDIPLAEVSALDNGNVALQGTMPAAVDAGFYYMDLYSQAGGTPAQTDWLIATLQIYWNSTTVVPVETALYSLLNAAIDASETVVTNAIDASETAITNAIDASETVVTNAIDASETVITNAIDASETVVTNAIDASETVITAAIAAGGGGGGSVAHTITINTPSGAPISDVDIWVSTDVAGTNVVANSRTDEFGKVTFMLDPGSYYVWCQKAGVNFTNPTTEVVL